MSQTRYREERTLVRRLCRLPGEDRTEFKRKVARLREHFERFNVDVSELCQWLMGLRRECADADKPGGFGTLGDFILEPSLEGSDADETERDRWRLAVFDDAAGLRRASDLGGRPVPESLRQAMERSAGGRRTPTSRRLFERLRVLGPAHRLVLLKAATEWTVARYQRGVENWVRQREEWEKEKTAWEGRHPALTEEVRNRFTDVFKSLRDPERDGSPGMRRKNPRICGYERLRENKDNCIYAGEKGHGPLCWKYVDFVKDQKARNKRFNKKHFAENAEKYLAFRAAPSGVERATEHKRRALERLYKDVPRCQRWFEDAWTAYLRFLGLNEQTVVQSRRLPHCLKIGETWEKSQCQWNPHTELCRQYKEVIERLDTATLALEPAYREWRREYLAGPRKPSFRYPSSRELPMPKIFGEGFHEIDFERSVLRLRLDDMPAGQWIEFGFVAWPRHYRPSKKEVKVTSVHVHFVGTRARAGFRFDVAHQRSRFNCTQDDLDELRSRQFPRRAQDQAFLEAARKRLLESFSGDAERDLRLLAVDMGETGACAAVYQGRTHEKDVPLRIVKIEKLYSDRPEALGKEDSRGLRKEHVGRHLEKAAEGAAEVAAHRRKDGGPPATPGDYDFRGLKRHVAWMIRDWVRLNAAQVTAAAEEHRCDLIVFESLRGFTPPGYDKLGDQNERKKRWLAMFAYGRVRRKATEKAVERGMRVATVPYFKSSQFCSACGHEQQNKGRWRKNKGDRLFKCECGDPKAWGGRGQGRDGGRMTPANGTEARRDCGCTANLNSDANAARVLARVFWGEICLPSPEAELS